MRRTPIVVVIVGSILVAALAPAARAADEEPGPTLLEDLVTLRKAGRASDLVNLLEGAPAIYQSTGSGVQTKLRSELGKIVKDVKLGAARTAAVDTLTKLNDPKAAWKVISKSMPSTKLETAAEFELAVIDAAGRLAQAKAVKPLVDLAAKAKDARMAAAAATALGGFKDAEKVRVKIAEEIIALGKRAKPAQASGGKSASPDAVKRWEILAPALVAGLNELTGRNLGTFDEWTTLWTEHKKRPKDLFPAKE